MADANSGVVTALRLLGAAGRADDVSVQNDLFEADAPMPVAEPKGKSGPQGGRPKGAINRSTQEWISLFLARHRAPLDVLGALYSRPWQELYEELQAEADKHSRTRVLAGGGEVEEKILINPLDVLKFQSAAAQALLPYVHKQQPKALEIETSRRGVVLLGDLVAEGETADDSEGLPLPPLVQNQ